MTSNASENTGVDTTIAHTIHLPSGANRNNTCTRVFRIDSTPPLVAAEIRGYVSSTTNSKKRGSGQYRKKPPTMAVA